MKTQQLNQKINLLNNQLLLILEKAQDIGLKGRECRQYKLEEKRNLWKEIDKLEAQKKEAQDNFDTRWMARNIAF